MQKAHNSMKVKAALHYFIAPILDWNQAHLWGFRGRQAEDYRARYACRSSDATLPTCNLGSVSRSPHLSWGHHAPPTPSSSGKWHVNLFPRETAETGVSDSIAGTLREKGSLFPRRELGTAEIAVRHWKMWEEWVEKRAASKVSNSNAFWD